MVREVLFYFSLARKELCFSKPGPPPKEVTPVLIAEDIEEKPAPVSFDILKKTATTISHSTFSESYPFMDETVYKTFHSVY